MGKFKVKIHRIDEYIIDIDENVWDDKALKSYSTYMSDVEDLEDVAKLVAIDQMNLDMTTKNGVNIEIISDMNYDFKITEINKLEIKKALYKEKTQAHLAYIRKGVAYYYTDLKDIRVYFDIPISDMGDADFGASMEAKLLNRWIRWVD